MRWISIALLSFLSFQVQSARASVDIPTRVVVGPGFSQGDGDKLHAEMIERIKAANEVLQPSVDVALVWDGQLLHFEPEMLERLNHSLPLEFGEWITLLGITLDPHAHNILVLPESSVMGNGLAGFSLIGLPYTVVTVAFEYPFETAESLRFKDGLLIAHETGHTLGAVHTRTGSSWMTDKRPPEYLNLLNQSVLKGMCLFTLDEPNRTVIQKFSKWRWHEESYPILTESFFLDLFSPFQDSKTYISFVMDMPAAFESTLVWYRNRLVSDLFSAAEAGYFLNWILELLKIDEVRTLVERTPSTIRALREVRNQIVSKGATSAVALEKILAEL